MLRGEPELFRNLVEGIRPMLYFSILALVKNREEADDLAQEALLKAFTHLPDFRGQCQFSTWLVQIGINEARMYLRKNRLRKIVSLDEMQDQPRPRSIRSPRPDPAQTLQKAELRAAVQYAISMLPEKYRDVYILRDLREESILKTAELLSLSPANVKTLLLRARAKIRDTIESVYKKQTTRCDTAVRGDDFFRYRGWTCNRVSGLQFFSRILNSRDQFVLDFANHPRS